MGDLSEIPISNDNHMLKCMDATKLECNNTNGISEEVHSSLIDSETSDDDDNESRNVSSSDNKEQEYSDTNDSISEKSITVHNDEEYSRNITELERKCSNFSEYNKELESRLEMVTKRYDVAVKEKELMVMRYAVSEKAILDVKAGKEKAEKNFKEISKENEILQYKLKTMGSEKSRICQMLDNKCYELKSSQQEIERIKHDMNSLETKLKWLQNSLRTEIDLKKESETKLEDTALKLQEAVKEIEQAKSEAEESIRTFQTSQENRAYVLDQQCKEQQANLILLRHEREDRENQIKSLQVELLRLQSKQKETLQENNTLSLKVQQLERERLEIGQRYSELRTSADQHRHDSADLVAKNSQLEQLKLQIQNDQEQLTAFKEQMLLLKQRNIELESDMEFCREREAELLLFTQKITDKNVRLQSEFTAMETKVQQLSCEHTLLKRATKEQETKVNILSSQLSEERTGRINQVGELEKNLAEKMAMCEGLTQEVSDQKGENNVMKRKYELSVKELNKELQLCRKKIEQYKSASNTSSSSSLNVIDQPSNLHLADTSASEQVEVSFISQKKSELNYVIQPETAVDKQTLFEHIIKLQRGSARKSEKIDFLEEHINSLVVELQRKTRLLQGYIIREQAGTLTSNKMDNNKAHIAKLHGIMASVYSSRIADNSLTLELSLDINRKLQAILEDALLKNITLKENVDTLGAEIDRLNKLLKPTYAS